MNRNYAAQLERVTKRYGDVLALEDVTVRVRTGEVLALLGPNGAGKTTAVSTMLGLLRPDAGVASLFGTSPNDVAAKVRVGAMLQISGVPPTLKVREHIASFAAYYPSPLPLDKVLTLAGLEDVADRQYGRLSGGQKQRVHFALAMVGDPDLLFLDEPTTGLDVESRRDFWRQVREFAEGGKTVVLTTHYLEEADALADRIVLVDHGRVIAEGTPAEIKARTAGKVVTAVTKVALERLATLPGVTRVERVGVATNLHTAAAEATVRALLNLDDSLYGLEVKGVSLEAAFLNITGGAGPAVFTPRAPREEKVEVLA
jgi:ABC-2 type transport system ATP-binding protein